MSTQLLIYETAVPVSAARHGKCHVEGGKDYGFARRVNSVPLMAVEFPLASSEYPIVFSKGGGEILPVVILGARANENLFLAANDQWAAQYVPAFIRRYPFIFAASDDGTIFTLCVDEAYEGVNDKGVGRPLFGDDGKPSAYVEEVLNFLQEYRAQFLRTQAFCRRLEELDLFEPMQAKFTLDTGKTLQLSGFHVIDRTKLKALPGDLVSQLMNSDELELIYLHLQSMRNFDLVKERLIEASAGDGAPPAPAQSATERAAEATSAR